MAAMGSTTGGSTTGDTPGLLDRARIVATAGFNRWMVPPAALCIHLCIGMAYGFSVFWKPLQGALVGADGKALPECSAGAVTFGEKAAGTLKALTATDCNWSQFDLGWMYTFFFVLLGVSAAIWGGWLERAGPRKAGVVSALCWCGGLLISALGVIWHQLWMLWIGSGVIGGIGLGLGYISPVSTLIKWFPDRRGMATGMAIMGFGGGAMIGSPLAAQLMTGGKIGLPAIPALGFAGTTLFDWPGFKTATDPGVWQTFIVMAAVYFLFMMLGAFLYRVPPAGWKPDRWTPPTGSNAMITSANVHLKNAHKTAAFWMLWIVLCMNVSAGIGIIGAASPMMQETFGGRLAGAQTCFAMPGSATSEQAELIKSIGLKATDKTVACVRQVSGEVQNRLQAAGLLLNGTYSCIQVPKKPNDKDSPEKQAKYASQVKLLAGVGVKPEEKTPACIPDVGPEKSKELLTAGLDTGRVTGDNASEVGYNSLSETLLAQTGAVGAGFVGLISLFNIFGRIAWASSSDVLGRKATYVTFFVLGAALYVLASFGADWKSLAILVAAFCIIASMYGGGFATIPAYLADMFGTQFVGAIHGRLLTAWSTAGILGPVIVNYLHDTRQAAGVPPDQIYSPIYYVLAGLLVIGFIANLLVRPVDAKWHMSDAELAEVRAQFHEKTAVKETGSFGIDKGGFDAKAVPFWLLVGIPLAWGVWQTVQKAFVLFV